MIVRVSSLMRAADVAKDLQPDTIISLVDPDTDLPDFQSIVPGVRHLTVVMNDTVVPFDPWAPKYDDIVKVFDFCKPSQVVLCHCHGGISRSTAVSIGLLVWYARVGIDDAVKTIYADSYNMSPNTLILQHIDDMLDMKSGLVSSVQFCTTTLDRRMMLWCNICKQSFIDGDNCPGKHWL